MMDDSIMKNNSRDFYHRYRDLFEGETSHLNGLHQQRVGYLKSLADMRTEALKNSIQKQFQELYTTPSQRLSPRRESWEVDQHHPLGDANGRYFTRSEKILRDIETQLEQEKNSRLENYD
jgi:hypothetical protein